jgi:phospholipid/cholesterol/gamma-HCH transport system substrate-binding protein
METRANHVLIGAFTVAILVLGFLFVLWIGKLRIAREWDYYDIVFNEAVTGLTVGGAVQFNGIQVGEVRKLSLAPKDPSQVIVRIRVGGGTPVKSDTRAKLTFTGLTGVSVIQLTGGSQQSPMLRAENGDEVPRIVADESALQKLLASSEDIIGVVNDMLRQLSRLLNQENLDKVAETIDHVEKLTGSFSKHEGDIDSMIADLSEASKSLKVTLQQSQQVMARLDTLAKSGNDVLNNEAKAAMATARASLESARRLTDNANAMIEQNRGAVSQFSNQGLAQVGPAVTELRAAIRNLRDLSDQLKEDPQSLLRGKKEQAKEHEAR